MRFTEILTLVLMMYCLTEGVGQRTVGNPLKTKRIAVMDCTLIADENTLMPHTVFIVAGRDTVRDFSVINQKILLTEAACKKLLGDTILLTYRSFHFNIEKPYFTIDSSLLTFKEKAFINAYEYKPDDNRNQLVESSGLDYKGSFSRGLSVGNSQSLVLNSNFDMQLIGDLGNGLKVVAAISDENLPIQAQGNTQQLQEFDKVFIQVSKDKTSVTAGDYELRRPNSYFMNYFKKLKGVTLASAFSTGRQTEVFTKGSFAISRGKFARQTLPTKEGNQGPYRLQGNNGERFIIVLAGTEKIYFNGLLLTRGFDYDYVIDYNRAEITFSPTRVVARDSRVIVEFEYTDISYLRSLYATQTEFKGQNWNINFNFYSEQDSKNSTGDIQLDSTDLKILELSGDDLSKSVRKSIRTITADEKKEITRILYKGVEDPAEPGNIILYFTENIDSAAYTAVFTEVGAGKGDYVIDNTKNKNARIYRYAGKNQGTYLPVVQLVPPEQKQMITLNGSYKMGKNTDVFAEVALSNLDKNRRSPINNNDNTGLSSHFSLKHGMKLDSAGRWMLNGHVIHEYLQNNFSILNPYRNPEFVRDWNIGQLTGRGDENLISAQTSLEGKSGFSIEYGMKKFTKGILYDGLKHEATIKYQGSRLSFRALGNVLTSESGIKSQKTYFSRPNVSIQYRLDKRNNWSVGTELDAENNQLKGINSDTLGTGSYKFQHLKWFVTNDFNKDFALKLAFSTRDDYFVKNYGLLRASNAQEIELAGKWVSSPNSDLQWSFIGRNLDIVEPSLLPSDKSKKTVLGRLDYSFAMLHQGIRSVTSYNTNSGQEPRIEYVFQKVEVGQGDYFLIGDSENPNLSNIQNFRYDPTNPLSRYIRLSLTNNEFIRTNNIEINQNLNIDPSKFLKPKEGKKISKSYKFISRFSSLTNIRITKKQMDGSETPLLSFIDFGLEDTTLVAYSALGANTLFFNRGNVKFDLQVGNRNNQSRIVQVSGGEDRGLKDLFFRSRWNIKNKADIFIILEKSEKSYVSEAFGDRNLMIEIYRLKPELSMRPTPNTRINLKYAYQDKKQKILSGDVAFANEFSSEFTIRKASKYSLDLTLSYVNIRFSGVANSPIEYDMLEGLKNGKNFLWNIIYTKRLAKNIDLTINYEGRKTGISPLVNVGRAQVKATF
ncbi:MAG: hypothetical protein IPP49_18000 [Saprospiraceae bacterium]|nr:hypothetical protein [Saprospiraceae bacterium]